MITTAAILGLIVMFVGLVCPRTRSISPRTLEGSVTNAKGPPGPFYRIVLTFGLVSLTLSAPRCGGFRLNLP
jgi:hypothetical protein